MEPEGGGRKSWNQRTDHVLKCNQEESPTLAFGCWILEVRNETLVGGEALMGWCGDPNQEGGRNGILRGLGFVRWGGGGMTGEGEK